MSQTVQGWARVSVTVEVPVGPWSDDSTVAEIADRARKEGPQVVQREAAKHGWKIVGDPRVQVVVVERDGGAL